MSEEKALRFRKEGEETAKAQRKIQKAIDAIEPSDGEDKPVEEDAVQAGERKQPENPLPKQHQTKPGIESELNPRPKYEAPHYKGSEKLSGMVALITGGDSGIGRSVATLFAREGADVAIAYLCEHEDAEVTRQAVEKEGRRCVLIPGDVRSSEFCEYAVETTIEKLGKLDVLVNNAAFQEHVPSLEDLTDEHLEMTMRTNAFGYIQMSRAALPHLKEGGSIVNNGSETGLFGQPILLDYSATKGAIHAFTRALSQSVAERGIRVNAVAPGPVWTPLNPADQTPSTIRSFGNKTDMNRPAQPEEIAPAFVFLASPVCASYITGIVLPVMGGVMG